MGCHQDYVQKTRLQIDRLRNDALDISSKTLQENERMIICSTIMKCADISNCVSHLFFFLDNTFAYHCIIHIGTTI